MTDKQMYTEVSWNGIDLWLKQNGASFFALQQKFDGEDYLKRLVEEYQTNQLLACDIAVELIEQGEILRKHLLRADDRRVPNAADLLTMSTPNQYMDLVNAVLCEITRDSKGTQDDVSDPWLDELKKKNG